MSDPRVVWMPGGIRTEIQLDSRQTADAFCLLVDEPPAGWQLPAHLHRSHAETIHVVSGRFESRAAGHTETLGPGDTVHIPAGIVHSGGNVGDTLGRRVVIFTPGGMDRFFLEAGAETPDADIDLAAALAAATRHGWVFGGEA